MKPDYRTRQARSVKAQRWGIATWFTFALVVGVASFVSRSRVDAAGVERAKRVLMLFSESKFLPGNELVEQAAKNVLQQSGHSLEFYAEYLDASRFRSKDHYRLFREYLQEKYARRPPDLILAFLTRQFELAGELPAKLFPKVPVVFGALTNDEIPRKGVGANVTGVVARIDAKGAVSVILKIQPKTQRIVVIGGTAPLDQLFLSVIEEAARSFSDRVQFDLWTTRPMSEIIQAVALLPPNTVILFTNLFRDVVGETFLPERAASLIAASASVPVYAVIEPTVGGGAIGGKVTPFEAAGRRVGELAQIVLAGTPPSSLPIEFYKEGVPIFDWRALKRWGISESRLPPASIIRFRQPSMWDQYKWYLIGTILVVAVQAVLIVGLLVLRARRRQSEASLRESEQRMSLAASAANLGLWTWDIVRDEVWVTPEGQRLFGRDSSSAINLQSFIDVLHPADREPTRQAISRSLEHGGEYSAEYRVPGHNDAWRWIAGRGQVEFGPNGKPVRIRGVAIDITERKRAEERFRLAVEASPSAIVMVNHEGHIVLVNAQTEQLFGYSREELMGKSVEILVPERFRGVHSRHQAGFFVDPQARVMGSGRDLLARRKDKTEFLADIGLYPIQTSEGTLVLTAIVDLTERKRTESELQRSREDLAHVARISTMGELATSLAHELNQPLGAILSNAEAAEMFLMTEPPALDEVRDILADIRKDDQRASEVIRRMRSLLRKRELAPQSIEINEAVEEVLKLLSVDASVRKVAMNFERTADLPRVWCDPVHLQQVVLNLVLNGMEAMATVPEEQRQIVVRTARGDNGTVKIAVADSGPGIPADKLPKLFEPFFTTKKDGMGMGLSIARSIVEAHHGQIWAENNRSVGATFYFAVPISKEASA